MQQPLDTAHLDGAFTEIVHAALDWAREQGKREAIANAYLPIQRDPADEARRL